MSGRALGRSAQSHGDGALWGYTHLRAGGCDTDPEQADFRTVVDLLAIEDLEQLASSPLLTPVGGGASRRGLGRPFHVAKVLDQLLLSLSEPCNGGTGRVARSLNLECPQAGLEAYLQYMSS
jgi:hypothetical protein